MEKICLNECFEKESSIYMKSYMFIKGYCVAKKNTQALVALALARRLHDGQYRKDGLPYIVHPLKVCSILISLQIDDDVILAASLLHDVLEDCSDKVANAKETFVKEYGFDEEVFEIIQLLTKHPGMTQNELRTYFHFIGCNYKAALIKLADRLHNSGTIYTYKKSKMRKYIDETEDFILPLASYCKKYYSRYTNEFSVLKSNIATLNHAMDIMMKMYDEHDEIISNEMKENEKP